MNETQFFSVVEDEKEKTVNVEKKKTKRHVDRVFAQYGGQAAPSPIKPLKNDLLREETEQSMNLVLEPSQINPINIQPDNASSIASIPSINCELGGTTFDKVTEASDSKKKEGNVENDSFSRKRTQNQMETDLEFPRASKHPHVNAPLLPQFDGRSKPDIHFTNNDEVVFVPNIVLTGSSQDDSQTEPMSVQEIGDAEVPLQNGSENSHKPEIPLVNIELCSDIDDSQDNIPESGNKRTTRLKDANKTLDMTLRTSGGVPFLTGVLLALDEALDPVVGMLVPHGLRKRGLNLIIVCVSVIIGVVLYYSMQ